MLRASGTLKVDRRNQRIFVDMDIDFVRYYNWFITREYWKIYSTPKYGAHMTVGNVLFHDSIDWHLASKYHGKTIEFEYDENIYLGGQTKGIAVWFVKTYSKEIERIKTELGIVEKSSYKGLHITISTAKQLVRDYWPEMITI